MDFSHTGLKFWIHQVPELLTPLSGVLTLQGRRVLQVKSLTAGPFASWKQRAVQLLRCLQKRSHDFTAELCWGQLCPAQSMEAQQGIVLCFYLTEMGFVGLYRVPCDGKTGSSDALTSLSSVFHILSVLSGRNDWFPFSSAMGIQGHEIWFITDTPLRLILPLCSHWRNEKRVLL